MGENAVTENIEWIFVRYALSESHAASSISRRLANRSRSIFAESASVSLSYRISFFLYIHDKSLYRVRRETCDASDTHYAITDIQPNAYQIGILVLAYLHTSVRTRAG